MDRAVTNSVPFQDSKSSIDPAAESHDGMTRREAQKRVYTAPPKTSFLFGTAVTRRLLFSSTSPPPSSDDISTSFKSAQIPTIGENQRQNAFDSRTKSRVSFRTLSVISSSLDTPQKENLSSNEFGLPSASSSGAKNIRRGTFRKESAFSRTNVLRWVRRHNRPKFSARTFFAFRTIPNHRQRTRPRITQSRTDLKAYVIVHYTLNRKLQGRSGRSNAQSSKVLPFARARSSQASLQIVATFSGREITDAKGTRTQKLATNR